MKSPKETEYPKWHYQPLNLFEAQMADPYSVLSAFFSQYTLPDLRLWLLDALEGNSESAAATAELHMEVLQVLEAAFLLYERNGGGRCEM
ncbi:hypothetical protein ACTHGU_07455 [Chitinophagaceae bacterium MMS25-I14]